MRVLLQRIKKGSVIVDNQLVGVAGKGILLFVGLTHTDGEAETKFLAEKCANLRIFDDGHGKKNHLSVKDIQGDVLVVSQFTLYGDCNKGRRPGFDKAAHPDQANPLYEFFVKLLRDMGLQVETGQFQAMMEVELINEGPVTYFLEK